jgi:hypothetical protein
VNHSPSRFCSRHCGGSTGVHSQVETSLSFPGRVQCTHRNPCSTYAKEFNTLLSCSTVCLGHSRSACLTGVPFNLQKAALLRGRGKVNTTARMAPRCSCDRDLFHSTEKWWGNKAASTATLHMPGCKIFSSSTINCSLRKLVSLRQDTVQD